MQRQMVRYYLSRALISAAFGGLLSLTGSQWWLAAFMGALTFGFFLWAPHSGRYAVHPERGVSALQQDERTRFINAVAGRNAFVGMMLALAAMIIYFGWVGSEMVPIWILSQVLVFGVAVYLVSDLLLRRK